VKKRRRTAAHGLVLAGAAAAVALAAMSAVVQADVPRVPAHAASYGGTLVATKDVPWVVAITEWGVGLRADRRLGKAGYSGACSAEVIGPNRVLTAAHCVDDFDLKNAAVVVNTDDLTTRAQRVVPIKRVWMPFQHQELHYGHDIALIETTRPVGVAAIPLATTRPRAGETATLFGFGDDAKAESGADPHPRLRRLGVVVQADCAIAGDPNAICVKAPNGGGPRSGDSGGPLVVFRNGAPELVGIASATDELGQVGVYTDAVAQTDFIAAPQDSALFPVLQQREVTIKGALKPGAKVSCAATFVPSTGLKLHYRWFVGPREVGPVKYFRDSHGRRVPYRTLSRPISAKRSITIPRKAAGQPISCGVQAYTGPFHRIDLGSEPATISGSVRR
jgi:trypsin